MMLVRCNDKHKTAKIQGSNPMNHRSSPLLSLPCSPAGHDAQGYKAVPEDNRGR